MMRRTPSRAYAAVLSAQLSQRRRDRRQLAITGLPPSGRQRRVLSLLDQVRPAFGDESRRRRVSILPYEDEVICVLLHTYLWREFKARLAVRDIARDMTRSWVVGRMPDETARQIHSSYGGGRDVSVHREAFAFAASWD